MWRRWCTGQTLPPLLSVKPASRAETPFLSSDQVCDLQKHDAAGTVSAVTHIESFMLFTTLYIGTMELIGTLGERSEILPVTPLMRMD